MIWLDLGSQRLFLASEMQWLWDLGSWTPWARQRVLAEQLWHCAVAPAQPSSPCLCAARGVGVLSIPPHLHLHRQRLPWGSPALSGCRWALVVGLGR